MIPNTKVKSSSGKSVSITVNPEVVFRRALMLSNKRDDISLYTVMSHPVGPVPTSMFHDDGSMRKTSKAELAHQLEAEASKWSNLSSFAEQNCIYIRDAMSILQMMDAGSFRSFNELASSYATQLLKGLSNVDTIVDVFDRYDNPNSVKVCERARRGQLGSARQYQVLGGRPIPPWKKFLSCSENKQSFVNFLSKTLVETLPTRLANKDNNCTVLIAGGFESGERTVSLTSKGVNEERIMYSNHEEADTRMIFHACDANVKFREKGVKGRVVIKTPDTDVIVLAIHYFPKLENVGELFVETGVVTRTSDLRRYIPIHEICASLSPTFTDVLPAVHALTGCDSTSAFFGIGKKTVYKTMKNNLEKVSSLKSLGEDDVVQSIDSARSFVSLLYDTKSKHKETHMDLNLMRTKLASKKDVSLAKLPPCEDSFAEHLKRASWQTRIWVHSHLPSPELGDPTSWGWQRKNEELLPTYFTGIMASELVQNMFCLCSLKNACSKNCVCRQNSLPCIDLCLCESSDDCTNPFSRSLDVESDGEDEN